MNVDRSDRQSVSDAVVSFVNIINEEAEPLFKCQKRHRRSGTFRDTLYRETKWFDNECRVKKAEYHDALNVFNAKKQTKIGTYYAKNVKRISILSAERNENTNLMK